MRPRTLLDSALRSAAAARAVDGVVRLWTSALRGLPAAEGIRRMLVLDEILQARVDALAAGLDDGVHAKHRLTRYHDFFAALVEADDRVLDVGCGKGELAHDLAVRTGARVTGLDFNASSLAFARERFGSQIELVEADALEWTPTQEFDVVVLSNVLEHIAPRVELLRSLRETTHARRFLIRVPSRERDWLVPLRDELGLDSRSDPTHETEYTPEQLAQELHDAGLEVESLDQRWGELWVSARAPSTTSAA